MIIRKYSEQDSKKLLDLFCATIKEVSIQDYTLEQVSIWGSRKRVEAHWDKSFDNKMVWIAEEQDEILGFCELTNDGYIDRFYCASGSIGKGIGKKLYQTLELAARDKGILKLSVAASITARTFFLGVGFEVLQEQTVFIDNISFNNFLMEKNLN